MVVKTTDNDDRDGRESMGTPLLRHFQIGACIVGRPRVVLGPTHDRQPRVLALRGYGRMTALSEGLLRCCTLPSKRWPWLNHA